MMKLMKKKVGIVRSLMILAWVVIVSLIVFASRLQFFKPERSITVLAWSAAFDRAYVKKFEKETGIRVHLSTYSTNEELLVKLQSSKGKDYDLIVPSDYVIARLKNEGLLKKLDKNKLSFLDQLNPLLLGFSFDPKNEYTIPLVWDVFCIGYDTNKIDPSRIVSPWDLVFTRFNHHAGYRIVMTNDPLEAISFATQYLFGPVSSLSPEQIKEVESLLKNQKAWVENYTNLRGDYLLGSGAVDAAIMQSAEIWRALAAFKHLDFVIPHDALISIEHCAIPVGSEKESLVYEFLNFFYTRDAFINNYREAFNFPARMDVIDALPVTDRQRAVMRSSPEEFKRYSFIRDLLPERKRFDLWVAVKS